MVFTKGAVEQVLGFCSHVKWTEAGGFVDMTEHHRGLAIENMEALAAQGLRVLALASRDWEGVAEPGTGQLSKKT